MTILNNEKRGSLFRNRSTSGDKLAQRRPPEAQLLYLPSINAEPALCTVRR